MISGLGSGWCGGWGGVWRGGGVGEHPRPVMGVARSGLWAPAAQAATGELVVGAEAQGGLGWVEDVAEVVDGGGVKAERGGEVRVAVGVVGVAPWARGSEAQASGAGAADIDVVRGGGGWVGGEAVARNDEGRGPCGGWEEGGVLGG